MRLLLGVQSGAILGLIYFFTTFCRGLNDEQTNDDDDTLEVIVGDEEIAGQTNIVVTHG